MVFSFDGDIINVPRANLKPIPLSPMVSVVMTTFRRPTQLAVSLASIAKQTYKKIEVIVVEDGYANDGTPEICRQYGATYIQRRQRPDRSFSNPAVPWNIGIRRAKGDIVILQCAECKYETRDGIENMILPIIADPAISTHATVRALDPSGMQERWLNHPDTHPHCYLNYCQAVSREALMAIHGFDESFTSWGYDDNNLSFRLQYFGMDFRYATDVLVSHQWHTHSDQMQSIADRDYYERQIAGMKAAQKELVIANRSSDWGNPDS